MRIVTLKQEQFDKYSKTHKYRNYLQTVEYANVMSSFGYNAHFLGFVEDDELIGATLIIYKEVMLNYKIAYCPRGILFDYENSDNVKLMTRKLKKLLSKQGFIMLRMDPYIPLSVRSNTGDILNINNKGEAMINNLIGAGFEYKGKNLFFENENPRWESLVLLDRDSNELFNNFDKRIRTKIRRAINSGVDIQQDNTKNIKLIYNFIKTKQNKPITFYKRLIDCFGNNAEVYLLKINTEMFVINSRQLYEQELQNNEQINELIRKQTSEKERNQILNKKMESDKLIASYKNSLLAATDLLKENPDGIIIGGGISIIYDNAAFLYVDGYDDQYSYLNPTYLLKWKLIEKYQKMNLKYINLNGVAGEFEKENQYSGLNETKLGFHSIVTEYIGEFDIILNSFVYNLYKKMNEKK